MREETLDSDGSDFVKKKIVDWHFCQRSLNSLPKVAHMIDDTEDNFTKSQK